MSDTAGRDGYVTIADTCDVSIGNPLEVHEIHLDDLQRIATIQEEDDGVVKELEIDLESLVLVMTSYLSQEELRHNWR